MLRISIAFNDWLKPIQIQLPPAHHYKLKFIIRFKAYDMKNQVVPFLSKKRVN